MYDPLPFIRAFLISLVAFSIFIEILRYSLRKRNKDTCLSNAYSKVTYKVTLEKITLILIVASYVFLSYFRVLLIAPLSGLLRSDPANYALFANKYVYYRAFSWIYIGVPIFLLVISYIVGLPMHYAFAGLQFLQALLPLSFYVSIIKFSKNEKVGLIATFLILFLNGLTSLLLLVNYDMLISYLTGNQLSVLWDFLFKRTGSPGSMNPQHLTASTLDISLVLFSIAYTYDFLVEKEKQKSSLYLSSLFAGAAFFFHSFNFVLLFICMLMVFFVIGYKRRQVTSLLFLTVIMIVFFDFLSGFYFISYFLPLRIKYIKGVGNIINSILFIKFVVIF